MAIVYPLMSDMVLELSKEGTTWLALAEGVTDITPSLNRETSDKYYMNKGGAKTTISSSFQRIFAVTGDLAEGDPAIDSIMAHAVKFGEGVALEYQYRYYNKKTKKGEKGNATVIVNNDGGGPANERMAYDVSVNVSGIPTAYTHTP